jgi:hypothetical protein
LIDIRPHFSGTEKPDLTAGNAFDSNKKINTTSRQTVQNVIAAEEEKRMEKALHSYHYYLLTNHIVINKRKSSFLAL